MSGAPYTVATFDIPGTGRTFSVVDCDGRVVAAFNRNEGAARQHALSINGARTGFAAAMLAAWDAAVAAHRAHVYAVEPTLDDARALLDAAIHQTMHWTCYAPASLASPAAVGWGG